MFARLTGTGAIWADGVRRDLDAIVWCTGFRPALRHLRTLDVPRDAAGELAVDGPIVRGRTGLYLLGYGDWCGPASATLIGVGQWARRVAADIADLMQALDGDD